MRFTFNPTTGYLDRVLTTDDIDAAITDKWVNETGDTMTGELDMEQNAIVLRTASRCWKLTVDNNGNLITTTCDAAVSILRGQPIGLMGVTYANDVN